MNNETQPLSSIVQATISQAETWQARAFSTMTKREKTQHRKLSGLVKNPADKHQLIRILDQVLRTDDPERAADQLTFLLRKYGVPSFLSSFEQLMARTLQVIGTIGAEVSMPMMRKYILALIQEWVLIDQDTALSDLLQDYRVKGITTNVNRIGEALLGEREAACRLEQYLTDLKNPEIPYISVKISTLFSQIDPLASKQALTILEERLSMLYREAITNVYTYTNGRTSHKFINLDMEEFRDAALTTKLLIKTAKKSEFLNLTAGITLQSYLPDFSDIQNQILTFAKERCERGGAALKMRLVKGANLEMERTEGSLHGWPSAPFESKLETDAHYKIMLHKALIKENAKVFNVGIASHNIFDLAYGYTLAKEQNSLEHVTFEMLNGMSPHVQRTLVADKLPVILYTPVVSPADVNAAIAYLVRRLDENTCQGHFLRDSFLLKVGSEAWNQQKDAFIESWELAQQLSPTRRRHQNRQAENISHSVEISTEFVNEPDTDFALETNQQWAKNIKATWCKSSSEEIISIPVVVGGHEQFNQKMIQDCRDISQPSTPIVIAQYAQATADDVNEAIITAKLDPDGWRMLPLENRKLLLAKAAQEIKRKRSDFIGLAAAVTGKVFREMDSEVSEAIDFALYYPQSMDNLNHIESLRIEGKGVVVVIAPWNFPLAIPAGGIFAALAAGNTVILKPSSASVPIAWLLCQCCWEAGISKKALQFLPCKDNKLATKLATHPDVDCVIFTGSTQTIRQMLVAHPTVKLIAETGGKNSTIITAMADIDQAIKNVMQSAFSNSGQKCSATSLLIVEQSVFDNPQFARKLADAVSSLSVGYAWDTQTFIGPLIAEPSDTLSRGMRIDNKESWLVEPKQIGHDVRLWSPGIKWNVEQGSFTHTNELFGPVLGVMRALDLKDAVELANNTGYGLTAGIESLDIREQQYWMDNIRAGNLYINRPTTGAIVYRQPFGGIRLSNFGPGLKTGGPHYIVSMLNINEVQQETLPKPKIASSKLASILRMLEDQVSPHSVSAEDETNKGTNHHIQKALKAGYCYYERFNSHFSRPIPTIPLRGQDNIIRYRPVGTVMVRLHPKDTAYDILTRILATYVTENKLFLSAPPEVETEFRNLFSARIWNLLTQGEGIHYQTDEEVAAKLGFMDRIRYASPDRIPAIVRETASRQGIFLADLPPLIEGRIELLYYMLEQSVCTNYHRYGNLGDRG